jgi:hypothetical protein
VRPSSISSHGLGPQLLDVQARVADGELEGDVGVAGAEGLDDRARKAAGELGEMQLLGGAAEVQVTVDSSCTSDPSW